MCGFLRKVVNEKDIFLLKNQQQNIWHCYIGVGYAKTKKSSNPSYFPGGGILEKLGGGGNFSKPILF